MSLKQRIQDDVKSAMRAKDKPRLATLRLVTAAIKQQEVDTRSEPDDGQVLAILEKMIKQRRDSEQQYVQAGRQELADQETFEIGIIQAYMPEPIDEAELEALVAAAIEQAGATSMKNMGKVMAQLRSEVQGRADMGAVSARVKARLAG